MAEPAGGVSRLSGQGARCRRSGDSGQRRQALRPLPRSHHVPDRGPARAHHRLRRARARTGGAEVPEFAGDRAVRKRARALRTVSRGGARFATPAA
jgi:hypothetical protein